MAGDEPIVLDGRTFRKAAKTVTAAQDDYMLVHLADAGATEKLMELATGVEGKARAKELLYAILKSRHAYFILAAALTEDGKKWQRDEADRNAAIFEDITDVDEKSLMRNVMIDFVMDFFRLGEASLRTSLKSSSPTATDPATASAAPETSARSAA